MDVIHFAEEGDSFHFEKFLFQFFYCPVTAWDPIQACLLSRWHLQLRSSYLLTQVTNLTSSRIHSYLGQPSLLNLIYTVYNNGGNHWRSLGHKIRQHSLKRGSFKWLFTPLRPAELDPWENHSGWDIMPTFKFLVPKHILEQRLSIIFPTSTPGLIYGHRHQTLHEQVIKPLATIPSLLHFYSRASDSNNEITGKAFNINWFVPLKKENLSNYS